MNEQDRKKLSLELCRRWKGKMNADDLAYWARELDDYALTEIVEALTKFKNSSRFVPKPAEILKLLPRRVDGASAGPVDEGSFADVLRRQSRQFEGRCDAEVYLRYYRQLWVSYGKGNRNLDAMKRQINDGCRTNLINAGMDEGEADRSIAFIFDSPEMFRIMLNELRNANTPDPFAVESTEHQFT